MLKRTFQQRKTPLPNKKPLFAEEMYDENSDRQTLWSAFLNKGDIRKAPVKLSTTAKKIEQFFTYKKTTSKEMLLTTKTVDAQGYNHYHNYYGQTDS
jgi:hypothetical protein